MLALALAVLLVYEYDNEGVVVVLTEGESDEAIFLVVDVEHERSILNDIRNKFWSVKKELPNNITCGNLQLADKQSNSSNKLSLGITSSTLALGEEVPYLLKGDGVSKRGLLHVKSQYKESHASNVCRREILSAVI